MSDYFKIAWESTGKAEGGFSDNPNDSGGPTNFGITQVLARAYGYKGEMEDLTREQAYDIAKRAFWNPLLLDFVAPISFEVAREIFDTAFLCGMHAATIFFQDALNALNRQQKDYEDVTADGTLGSLTVAAFRAYVGKRGADGITVILRVLNASQCEYLRQDSQNRPKDEDFFYGWVLNRVSI
jgi:lysozyme family protein